MESRTMYEERILSDIQGFSERDQSRLYRIFHYITQEIISSKSDERQMTDEFLSVCGTWKDDRSAEEQLQDIYSARKSTNRTEKIF